MRLKSRGGDSAIKASANIPGFVQNVSALYVLTALLTRNMEDSHGTDYGYIPGVNFHEIKQKMLYDENWGGFFIYGEGGSGKSALAMAIAHYLVWIEKIDAPVWIKIDNDEVTKLIEEENKEKIKSISEKQEKIEKYILDKIDKKLKSYIDGVNLKNEFSEKEYLVVIDNLEMNENNIIRILMAVDKIFSSFNKNPYVIITSRTKCGGSELQLIDKLRLHVTKAPLLNKEQVALFVKNIVANKDYVNKLDFTEKNNAFMSLVQTLYQKLGDLPNMIIVAVGLLEYLSVAELCDEIEKRLGSNEVSIRKKKIEIYHVIFSYLNTIQMQVLYQFIFFGDENPITEEDIYTEIKKSKHWGKVSINKPELKRILRTLLRYNLLYSTEIDNKTMYGIKSIAYHTFLFEKEFLGPEVKPGEYLRDVIVRLDLQLEKALQYDQDTDIIEPLLKKIAKNSIVYKNIMVFPLKKNILQYISCNIMLRVLTYIGNSGYIEELPSKALEGWKRIEQCKKCSAVKNMFFLSACQYSSKIEVLSLLKDFGCDINTRDEHGKCAISYVLSGNNTSILDWLYNHVSTELLGANDYSWTVFYSAIVGRVNADTFYLLFEKMPDFDFLKCTNDKGETLLDVAEHHDNFEALKLFLEKEPELISRVDEYGDTVFHRVVRHGKVEVLKSLLEIPFDFNLRECKNKKGETVFHLASRYWEIL